MKPCSRREALGMISAATASAAFAPLNAAIPISDGGIRIGLSQYSLRQLFKSGELDVMDYPKFARDNFGITDIDVWEGGMPADKQNDGAWLKALKNKAIDGGSRIFLWMTNLSIARRKPRKIGPRLRSLCNDPSITQPCWVATTFVYS